MLPLLWVGVAAVMAACEEEVRYVGPVCGNGRVEAPETCDDGNRVDGDGCTRGCRLETAETCDNGVDDDGNGWVDCLDPACVGHLACAGEICGNGIDDDGNGRIDCDDAACRDRESCRRPEICTNGVDDDGNGQADCEDAVCGGHPACGACDPTDALAPGVGDVIDFPRNAATREVEFPCAASMTGWQARWTLAAPAGARLSWDDAPVVFLGREEEPGETCGLDRLACTTAGGPGRFDFELLPPGVYRLSAPAGVRVRLELVEPVFENCTNGFDDDNDGLADCADPDCVSALPCQEEICDNGADDNADGLADCADPACAVFCAPPEICGNGRDDDLDGRADCRDVDCAGTETCRGSACVVHFDFGTLHRGAVAAAPWSTADTPNSFLASCGGAGADYTLAFTLDAPANVLVHLTQTGSHSLTLSTEAGAGTPCLAGEIACFPSPGVHMPGTWSFSALPPARYFLDIDAVTQDATGMGQVEIQTAGLLDEWCANGADDNGDGLADCADPRCATLSLCRGEDMCRNGLDDDSDGWTDCADPDCMGTLPCGPGDCLPQRQLGPLAPGHPLSAWVDLSGGAGTGPLPCASGDPVPVTVLAFSLSVPSRVRVRLLPDGFAEPVAALAAAAGLASACDSAVHQCAAVPAPGIQGSFETLSLPAGGPYYLLVSSYAAPAAGRMQMILEAR